MKYGVDGTLKNKTKQNKNIISKEYMKELIPNVESFSHWNV